MMSKWLVARLSRAPSALDSAVTSKPACTKASAIISRRSSSSSTYKSRVVTRSSTIRAAASLMREHLVQAIELLRRHRQLRGIAGEDAGHVPERLAEVHARTVDVELANLLVVRRPSHLQH